MSGEVKAPNPNAAANRHKLAIGCGTLFGLAVLMAVIGTIAGAGHDTPAAAPAAAPAPAPVHPTIAAADRTITHVEADGDQLWVLATLAEPRTELDPLLAAGTVLSNVGKRLKAGAPDAPAAITAVHLKLRITGEDRLGNKGDAGFMTLDAAAADLRAANYANLDPLGVLNLAVPTDIDHRLADESLIVLCRDPAATPEFCARAR